MMLSENHFWSVSQVSNLVKNWRISSINNPKPLTPDINVYAEFE